MTASPRITKFLQALPNPPPHFTQEESEAQRREGHGQLAQSLVLKLVFPNSLFICSSELPLPTGREN